MTLATLDADGGPDARMVLLKGHGPDGFRFFTNYESAKAREIAADPRGALVIYWRELDRQVRVRGTLERLADGGLRRLLRGQGPRQPPRRLGLAAEQAARRPRGSRPAPGRGRGALAGRRRRSHGPSTGEASSCATGTVEFWQGQQARLHDRFVYTPEGGRLEDRAPRTLIGPALWHPAGRSPRRRPRTATASPTSATRPCC